MNQYHWWDDPTIKNLSDELVSQYNCHTIILYGSRATGKISTNSDYDIAGICKEGEIKRIARFEPLYQIFVDIFIYPESAFNTIEEEHLIMHKGIVIKEKEQFGSHLLNQINSTILTPPPHLPDYELKVRKVWYQKMLMRAKTRDVDGLYRHIWTLHSLIEDYFAFRHLRYLGPKKSFEYLQEQDPQVLALYESALNDTQNTELLALLIKAVLAVPYD